MEASVVPLYTGDSSSYWFGLINFDQNVQNLRHNNYEGGCLRSCMRGGSIKRVVCRFFWVGPSTTISIGFQRLIPYYCYKKPGSKKIMEKSWFGFSKRLKCPWFNQTRGVSPPIMGGEWKFQDFSPPYFGSQGGESTMFLPPHYSGVRGRISRILPPLWGGGEILPVGKCWVSWHLNVENTLFS